LLDLIELAHTRIGVIRFTMSEEDVQLGLRQPWVPPTTCVSSLSLSLLIVSLERFSRFESLFLSALEATLSEARKTVAARLIQPLARGRNALIYRFHFRCGEIEMKKRLAIVRRWIEECRRFHRGRKGPGYAITIAFYPRKKREETR